MNTNGQYAAPPTDAATLNDRITQVVGEDMLDLVEEVRHATSRYLKQKAEVEYYNDLRKVILYEVVEELRARYAEAGEKVTEKQLETEARTHSRYKKLLNARKHASEALAEVEADYYALRNRLDVLQAQLAYAKSEQYFLQNA